MAVSLLSSLINLFDLADPFQSLFSLPTVFHRIFDEVGAEYPDLEKEHW
jgi:hypothetical protein